MPIARTTARLRNTQFVIRSASTSSKDVTYPPPRLQRLSRQPQPTVSSEDGHRTLRVRQHGNKSLPLPPFLDPKRIAAKKRYTTAKPEVGKSEQTDFQKQLAANPLAHALATPIRQCHITRARLPTHFLHPFSASISHTPLPTDGKRPNQPITVSLVPHALQDLPQGTMTLKTSTYVLNTRGTMERLGMKRGWGRMVDVRMQENYARLIGKKDARSVDVGREWVWDQEMPEVVLKQLRETVVGHVDGLLAKKQCFDFLAPVGLERGAEQPQDVAAVLKLRDAGLATEIEAGLPKHLPVYALEQLLGQEIHENLCKRLDSACEEHGHAVCNTWLVYTPQEGNRISTMPLLLSLHRLANYLNAEGEDKVNDAGKKKKRPQ